VTSLKARALFERFFPPQLLPFHAPTPPPPTPPKRFSLPVHRAYVSVHPLLSFSRFPYSCAPFLNLSSSFCEIHSFWKYPTILATCLISMHAFLPSSVPLSLFFMKSLFLPRILRRSDHGQRDSMEPFCFMTLFLPGFFFSSQNFTRDPSLPPPLFCCMCLLLHCTRVRIYVSLLPRLYLRTVSQIMAFFWIRRPKFTFFLCFLWSHPLSCGSTSCAA